MGNSVTSATSPPRRRLARDERAQQLLEVAEAVFGERGIQAASMDDIAEAAGVTKPVVYDHFGSKDGLIAAIVMRAGSILAAVVLDAVAKASGAEDALAQGLRAYFGFIDQRSAGMHWLLAEAIAPGSQAAAALEVVRDRQAELIAGLLREDLPGCDLPRARLYAQVVVGATERLATRPSGEPAASVEALTAAVMDVIWCGFSSVRSGSRWTPAAPA